MTVNAGYDYKFSNNVVLGVFGWIGVTPVRSEVTFTGTERIGRLAFKLSHVVI